MATVHANGLNFHVNRFRTGPEGERPVVVCIHGLAVVDNAATSFVLGFHLAKDAEVITYDLRGHGRSDRPPTGYGIADHAADLIALIDALGITRPVHLVAFSYGGAVATTAAIRHPERMASVTLLDGVVPVAGWEKALFGTVRDFEEWIDDAHGKGLAGDDIVETIIRHAINAYGVTRRRAAAIGKRVHRLFETTSMREDIRNESVFDRDDYRRITCPVLGVYGTKSELYWLIDVLPELIPDVTLATVPGADHLDVFWRIDEIRPIVRRFIGLQASGDSPDSGIPDGQASLIP